MSKDLNYKELTELELKSTDLKIKGLELDIDAVKIGSLEFNHKWRELNSLRWKRLALKDRLSGKNKKQLGMEEYHIPDTVKHNY